MFNSYTKPQPNLLFPETLGTFCWNPFHFIFHVSKDIVCWKMYFLGPPCRFIWRRGMKDVAMIPRDATLLLCAVGLYYEYVDPEPALQATRHTPVSRWLNFFCAIPSNSRSSLVGFFPHTLTLDFMFCSAFGGGIVQGAVNKLFNFPTTFCRLGTAIYHTGGNKYK